MAAEGSSSKNPPTSNEDKEFIPGFKTVNEYSSQALRALLLSTKASNNLPNAGDDYDYYSSFDTFRDVMDIEGKRLLEIIQNVIRYHGAKGNMLKNTEDMELEDKFDVLVDANDQLLERVGSFLDEAAGLNKQETPLVITTMTQKQISGSWNKKASSKGLLSSYRLLSGKHIQRPQLKFKEKIDNSTRPFVPKIREKPNALKPLPESLVIAQQDDSVQKIMSEDVDQIVFPHPYQYELDNLTRPSFMLVKEEPQETLPVATTLLKFIDDVPNLEKLCQLLKQQREIAVDLEHHSYRSYQGITCLIQLSTRSQDFIIDAVALRSDLHILNEVFTDPQIVKVFHGADMDIEWLQRDFGLYVVNMFDTGQAARVLNLGRYSLAYLLMTYCSVEVDKQYQLADWRIRPLPEALINYAREDTHYLLYIYDRLRNQLLDRGNDQKNLLMAALTRSTQTCARKYEKLIVKNRHMDLYQRSKKTFNAQQMYALKEIYLWRDSLARQEDESTGYVLPNHMMLQIAALLPKDSQGILACCNPIPPLVRQNLGVLHHINRDAREVAMTKPIKLQSPQKPSIKQHPKYNLASPFNCPHDFSHQEKRQLNQDVCVPLTGPALIAESSSMFNSSKTLRVAHVLGQVVPQLSVFAWGPQVAPKLTANQKKAAELRSSFVSPFDQYLPSKALHVVSTAPVMKIPDSPASSMESPVPQAPTWRLKPNTPVARPQPVVTTVVTAAQPLVNPEEEEEGLVALSQLAPVRKKKKKNARDRDAEIIEAVYAGKSADQPDSNAPLGAPKRTKNTEPEAEQKTLPVMSTPRVTAEGKKRKKTKITLETLEKEGFEGHDYTQTNLNIFTEPSEKKIKTGKKKRRKEFDPDSAPLESEFKTGAKPRLTAGRKSQTFGKQPEQKAASWPKR